MTRARAKLQAIVLAAIGSICFAPVATADEPAAKPKAKPAVAKPAAEPAKKEIAKKPEAPAAKKEGTEKIAPKGAPKKGATSPAIDKGAKGKATKDKAADGEAKSLIAPAGLLSRPPALLKATRPGLGKLNLNRAKIEDLQRLPGVGFVWAPRILAGRPYRTWGDVSRTGIPFTVILALSRETELGQR